MAGRIDHSRGVCSFRKRRCLLGARTWKSRTAQPGKLWARGSEAVGRRSCIWFGYAKGFVRATSEALGAGAICLPQDATSVQAEALVLKYLRANPEVWQKNAVDLVAVALKTTFPCDRK